MVAQRAPQPQRAVGEGVAEEALPALVRERHERLARAPVDGFGGDLRKRERALGSVDAEQADAEVAVGLDGDGVAVDDLLAGAAASVAAPPEPGEPDRESLGGLAERLCHRVARGTLARSM